MSNLADHARRELERFETDENYIEGICNVMRAFSDMGHSGGSASIAIPQIHKLLQFKNLSPLTNDPEEWIQHQDGLWQNRRNPKAFSNDAGKHFYFLSDRDSHGDVTLYLSEEAK